jgi:hypothetical protein
MSFVSITFDVQVSAPVVRCLADGWLRLVLLNVVTQLESLILAQNERWRHA